jgi:ribosomal protein S18 acetylase RimI-like enzyme
MNILKIRPMTDPEFEAWQAHSRVNYAAEKEKEGLSPEDAKAEAEKSFAKHLPQGKLTEGHNIYAVIRAEDGLLVGHLWWGLQNHGSKKVPWIFDIELLPNMRGKGYGRATMELAQRDVLDKGFSRLGLHVFGHNKVARSLYESLGFETSNVVMYKELKS